MIRIRVPSFLHYLGRQQGYCLGQIRLLFKNQNNHEKNRNRIYNFQISKGEKENFSKLASTSQKAARETLKKYKHKIIGYI